MIAHTLSTHPRQYSLSGRAALALPSAWTENQGVNAGTLANLSPQRPGLLPLTGTCARTESSDPCGFSLSGTALRAIAGAASGAARKETATRYGAEVRSPGAEPKESVGLACISTPGGREGRDIAGPLQAVESSLGSFNGAGGAFVESLYSGVLSPPEGQKHGGRPSAQIWLARQCQCGGIIRMHELTGDRTAWTCAGCGRYGSVGPQSTDAEPLPTPTPENAPQGGLFDAADKGGAPCA